MSFKIDIDRLHLVFDLEDESLAVAFAGMEGFEVAFAGHAERFRTATGQWERRLVYASRGAKRRARATRADEASS